MSDHSWQFYLKSEHAWEAMLRDCEQAKVSIDFEQFIFNYDEIGRRFYQLFINKAAQGVSVRLILDAGGSYAFYNSFYHRELVRQGVVVQFFNPIKPWRINNFTSWFFRNHRKILIIDSSIGYAGGVGVEERMRQWRDTHLKISGPVVREMSYVFERMWQTIASGHYQRVRKNNNSQNQFSFLINSPYYRQRHIYHELLKVIRRAKRYIHLVTPYFVPSQRFLNALRRAAKRGVEIKLLLPEQSDHNMVDAAGRSYYGLLLRFGIKIFKFRDRMIHSKIAVVDDLWATIGSLNYDNLSFVYNYEANLITTDQRAVAEIKEQFMADLKGARQLYRQDWLKRSWQQKFFEYLTWPFHWIL